MNGSFRIASFAGIGVYLHWTFFLLASYITYVQGVSGLAFFAALFGCIVLHEFGHALTARRFGIPTLDITLLPIGGVARLERLPERPIQEFWVAIAGPAVNVVIAAVLIGVLFALGRLEQLGKLDLQQDFTLLQSLAIANISLVVFNLIPAFPMDGGRILRALLATRMNRVRATKIAATIGQSLAIFFGILCLFNHQWLLVALSVFIYLGAQGEAKAVEMRSVFQGVPVRNAMATRFVTLSVDDSMQKATTELLSGHQQDFPVLDGHQVVGMIFRRDIYRALADDDPAQRVGDVLSPQCPTVETTDSLDDAAKLMQQLRCPSLLVTEDGHLAGLLTSENVGEWTMIQAALRDKK